MRRVERGKTVCPKKTRLLRNELELRWLMSFLGSLTFFSVVFTDSRASVVIFKCAWSWTWQWPETIEVRCSLNIQINQLVAMTHSLCNPSEPWYSIVYVLSCQWRIRYFDCKWYHIETSLTNLMFLFETLFHILFPTMFEQSCFDVFLTFQNTSFTQILSHFDWIGSNRRDNSESYFMMHYSWVIVEIVSNWAKQYSPLSSESEFKLGLFQIVNEKMAYHNFLADM